MGDVTTSHLKVPIFRVFPLCSSGHSPPQPPGSFLYLSFTCVWTCYKWNLTFWSLSLFTHTGCVRVAHICGVRQSLISGYYLVSHYVNTGKFTHSSVDGHLFSLHHLLWIVLVLYEHGLLAHIGAHFFGDIYIYIVSRPGIGESQSV